METAFIYAFNEKLVIVLSTMRKVMKKWKREKEKITAESKVRVRDKGQNEMRTESCLFLMNH